MGVDRIIGHTPLDTTWQVRPQKRVEVRIGVAPACAERYTHPLGRGEEGIVTLADNRYCEMRAICVACANIVCIAVFISAGVVAGK